MILLLGANQAIVNRSLPDQLGARPRNIWFELFVQAPRLAKGIWLMLWVCSIVGGMLQSNL